MTQDEFEERIRQLAGKLEESERRCAELAQYVEGCKRILVMHGDVSADYDLAQVLNKYWHLKVKYEPCEVDDFGRPIPPPYYECEVRARPVGLGTIDTWPLSAVACRIVPGPLVDDDDRSDDLFWGDEDEEDDE